jgi:hypothetical protein
MDRLRLKRKHYRSMIGSPVCRALDQLGAAELLLPSITRALCCIGVLIALIHSPMGPDRLAFEIGIEERRSAMLSRAYVAPHIPSEGQT